MTLLFDIIYVKSCPQEIKLTLLLTGLLLSNLLLKKTLFFLSIKLSDLYSHLSNEGFIRESVISIGIYELFSTFAPSLQLIVLPHA